MKVAIVHDFLHTMGGAERVVLALAEAFPGAPIYTLTYDSKLDEFFGNHTVHTSYLQRLSWLPTKFLFPLYPQAIESFDLTDYDVVISSSHSYAKNIITSPHTLHISYVHSPMRYVWDAWHTYLDQQKLIAPLKWWVTGVLHNIRIWDKVGSSRVDSFIANSNNVAERIRKYYRRSSTVIYPPVDTHRISPASTHEDYFLVVSRLSTYKQPGLAVQACKELGVPLVVIGTGEMEAELKKLAGPETRILGWVDDATKIKHLQNCRALIFPGEEDFGIVPVEAMAAGKPVIAYRKGGLLETVTPATGIFFNEPTTDSLKSAIQEFLNREGEFNGAEISAHAAQFSHAHFIQTIRDYVSSRYTAFKDGIIKT